INYAADVVFKNGDKEMVLTSGMVYQFYPTIYCDNASKLEIHRGTVHAEYTSGAAWPFPGEFGEFTLVVFGGGSGGAVKEIKRVTFKIYPCVASQSFDAEMGLYVLKISAGSFENIDFRLVLDGDKSIEEGTMAVVTAVGEHKLELYADGAAVNPELYAYYGMPTAEDLALRINVELESNVWDIPRTLDFSRWDANILLDGEAVTGEFLIDEDGDHVITVVDDEGNAVSNCFSIKVGDAEAAVDSELNVTFDNPHHLYFWFILIPVILVLIAMIGFLILRRVIV
ncbi:MAG: hypothetical protein IKM08_00655, partial [Clostridia bacterium]|nr:hypothetical protein [Clostridia bacterium]